MPDSLRVAALLGFLAVPLAGCRTAEPGACARATAAGCQAAASGPATAPSTQPTAAGGQGRPEDRARKDRERQRKLDRLIRNREVAQLNLAKAQTNLEHGELRQRDALASAEREFELSKRKLQIFQKFERPHRIARAELELRGVADSVREAEEELAQLELMYKDEQFADQTKEIVLERARRRLERSRRDLELRREEFERLKEITLPLEELELEHAAEQKKRAVLQTQRDNEAGIIDRQVALLNADAEILRIEQEIEELEEEHDEAARTSAGGTP